MADVRRGRAGRGGRIAFWALAGLALLVGHDAVYLVQIGPGESLAAMLRTAGHGYWGAASVALLGVALLAAVATTVQILRLRRRAAAIGARAATGDPGAIPRFVRGWAGLAALVTVAFAVQENVEHLAAHGHAPGTGALLGPENPLALPVIGLVSALAAFIATLVGRRHDTLMAAIASALRRRARPPRRFLRPPARLVAAAASVLARCGAGRAPPWVLASVG